jgi:hypothetical protein
LLSAIKAEATITIRNKTIDVLKFFIPFGKSSF